MLIYNKFLIITGTAEIPAPRHVQGTDKELIAWLQQHGADADADAIEKVYL